MGQEYSVQELLATSLTSASTVELSAVVVTLGISTGVQKPDGPRVGMVSLVIGAPIIVQTPAVLRMTLRALVAGYASASLDAATAAQSALVDAAFASAPR